MVVACSVSAGAEAGADDVEADNSAVEVSVVEAAGAGLGTSVDTDAGACEDGAGGGGGGGGGVVSASGFASFEANLGAPLASGAIVGAAVASFGASVTGAVVSEAALGAFDDAGVVCDVVADSSEVFDSVVAEFAAWAAVATGASSLIASGTEVSAVLALFNVADASPVVVDGSFAGVGAVPTEPVDVAKDSGAAVSGEDVGAIDFSAGVADASAGALAGFSATFSVEGGGGGGADVDADVAAALFPPAGAGGGGGGAAASFFSSVPTGPCAWSEAGAGGGGGVASFFSSAGADVGAEVESASLFSAPGGGGGGGTSSTALVSLADFSDSFGATALASTDVGSSFAAEEESVAVAAVAAETGAGIASEEAESGLAAAARLSFCVEVVEAAGSAFDASVISTSSEDFADSALVPSTSIIASSSSSITRVRCFLRPSLPFFTL